MVECIICGREVTSQEELIERNTDVGSAVAHVSCVTRLRAVLGDDSGDTPGPIKERGETTLLERHGDDWTLSKRDTSVTTVILAYLSVQPGPCEVKSVYDWLRRNEVSCSNPSEYVRKMRDRGEITVLNVDGARMIRITDDGIGALEKQTRESSRSSVS